MQQSYKDNPANIPARLSWEPVADLHGITLSKQNQRFRTSFMRNSCSGHTRITLSKQNQRFRTSFMRNSCSGHTRITLSNYAYFSIDVICTVYVVDNHFSYPLQVTKQTIANTHGIRYWFTKILFRVVSLPCSKEVRRSFQVGCAYNPLITGL